MNIGRPTTYTKELADKICEKLALGLSMRTICKEEDMPAMSSVFKWLRENKDFSEQYVLAKQEGTDAMSEDLMELGDEAIELAQTVDPKQSSAVVQAVKLKSDNLKWTMSKLKPKKYGDKLDMTTNGKDLPTPILNNVSINNSNTESSESHEAN